MNQMIHPKNNSKIIPRQTVWKTNNGLQLSYIYYKRSFSWFISTIQEQDLIWSTSLVCLLFYLPCSKLYTKLRDHPWFCIHLALQEQTEWVLHLEFLLELLLNHGWECLDTHGFCHTWVCTLHTKLIQVREVTCSLPLILLPTQNTDGLRELGDTVPELLASNEPLTTVGLFQEPSWQRVRRNGI